MLLLSRLTRVAVMIHLSSENWMFLLSMKTLLEETHLSNQIQALILKSLSTILMLLILITYLRLQPEKMSPFPTQLLIQVMLTSLLRKSWLLTTMEQWVIAVMTLTPYSIPPQILVPMVFSVPVKLGLTILPQKQPKT